MNSTRRYAALIFSALLGVGLLAGAASAGNPHGTAPGQAKKAQSSSSTHRTPPGQAKKASRSSTTHSGNSSSSTSSAGVKPSSTTQHNTHAAAGSNQTKLYGNGKTAGEIAQQNGASASTDLYGPGNSQPHKVAVCSKNGKTHYVDVHALKAHSSGNCAGESASASALVVHGAVAAEVESIRATLKAMLNVLSAAGVKGTQATVKTTHAGGVLGARHTLSKPVAGQSKAAKAVVHSASFTG